MLFFAQALEARKKFYAKPAFKSWNMTCVMSDDLGHPEVYTYLEAEEAVSCMDKICQCFWWPHLDSDTAHPQASDA